MTERIREMNLALLTKIRHLILEIVPLDAKTSEVLKKLGAEPAKFFFREIE